MNGTEMPYRAYWMIWLALLMLTVVMLAVEALGLTGLALASVLVGAMLLKATLIGGWFMHLRNENVFIVLCLVLGTLLTAAFLFFLIAPDGMAALEQAPR
jgi:caa(3)-type oxidase subunit IV